MRLGWIGNGILAALAMIGLAARTPQGSARPERSPYIAASSGRELVFGRRLPDPPRQGRPFRRCHRTGLKLRAL
ncbi:MAG: hypothetical protein ACK47B_10900 [Armatimonadota bacterium]